MSRWILTDPATSESWEMPISPNKMTSPHQAKDIKTAGNANGRMRSFKQKPTPKQWEWSGVIRSQAHYDAYVTWAQKPGVVHVSDHLGRTFEVFIQAFEPEDRQPTATTPWRLNYTVKTLLIRRVS